MATKAQWQRYIIRRRWVAKVAATADRTTEFNDMQVNDYAWKLNNSIASARWIKARGDIIA